MTLEDRVELAAWIGEIRLSWLEIERLTDQLHDQELSRLVDHGRVAIRATGLRMESLILGGDPDLDLGAVAP